MASWKTLELLNRLGSSMGDAVYNAEAIRRSRMQRAQMGQQMEHQQQVSDEFKRMAPFRQRKAEAEDLVNEDAAIKMGARGEGELARQQRLMTGVPSMAGKVGQGSPDMTPSNKRQMVQYQHEWIPQSSLPNISNPVVKSIQQPADGEKMFLIRKPSSFTGPGHSLSIPDRLPQTQLAGGGDTRVETNRATPDPRLREGSPARESFNQLVTTGPNDRVPAVTGPNQPGLMQTPSSPTPRPQAIYRGETSEPRIGETDQLTQEQAVASGGKAPGLFADFYGGLEARRQGQIASDQKDRTIKVKEGGLEVEKGRRADINAQQGVENKLTAFRAMQSAAVAQLEAAVKSEDPSKIEAALADLKAIATMQGEAVGVAQPTPAPIAAPAGPSDEDFTQEVITDPEVLSKFKPEDEPMLLKKLIAGGLPQEVAARILEKHGPKAAASVIAADRAGNLEGAIRAHAEADRAASFRKKLKAGNYEDILTPQVLNSR